MPSLGTWRATATKGLLPRQRQQPRRRDQEVPAATRRIQYLHPRQGQRRQGRLQRAVDLRLQRVAQQAFDQLRGRVEGAKARPRCGLCWGGAVVVEKRQAELQDPRQAGRRVGQGGDGGLFSAGAGVRAVDGQLDQPLQGLAIGEEGPLGADGGPSLLHGTG